MAQNIVYESVIESDEEMEVRESGSDETDSDDEKVEKKEDKEEEVEEVIPIVRHDVEELEERGDVTFHGRPAHSLAVHHDMGKMIVARKAVDESSSDDVLEQYNILPGWISVPEKTICLENGGVESVCFVGEQIVSCHLNGSITISHPHNDTVKRVQVCPAPLWSICAVDGQRAAMVSHSAILYVFNVEEGLVEWSLSLGVDNRLFSVAAKNNVIAVGATDTIFVVKDGAIKHTLSVARKERRLPTIVWSLVFFHDNVIASGDSRGVVSFWNADSGALIQFIASHQADVLSLTVEGNVVWAAGVDPRIMAFRAVAPNKYQVVQKRNGPTRDVKALAVCDDKVFAVGDDHEIFVGRNGCQKVKQQWNKRVCLGGGLAISRGAYFVDIYTTGQGEQEVEGAEEIVVARQPVYLARINTPRKLPLLACDLSTDGHLLALSTSESTTVYRLNPKSKTKAVQRLPLQARGATAVKVIKDAILVCSADFELWRCPLDGSDSTQILEQTGCGQIAQLVVSPCQRYAAVLTTRCQVFAIDLKMGESRLVRVDLPIDITFTDGDSLFVLTASAGFDEPKATKKILFEFPMAGGAARRSISARSLFNVTGVKGVRPVSIAAGPGDRLLVQAAEGSWVVINKARDETTASPVDEAAVPCAVQFRSESRICCCRVELPAPTTAPFKLKKFGLQ